MTSDSKRRVLRYPDQGNSSAYYSTDFLEVYQGELGTDGCQKSGYGKLWAPEFKYHGEFLEDLFHGQGFWHFHGQVSDEEETYPVQYEGEYSEGKKDGQGKETYSNGEYYIGDFKEGKKSGRGDYYGKNGKLMFSSDWEDDIPTSVLEIKEYFPNGNLKYDGNAQGGQWNGEGTLYYEDGQTIRYQGGFLNGEYHGKGTKYHPNGQMEVEGEFNRGKLHGECTLFYSSGRKKHKADYQEGSAYGKYVSYYDEESNLVKEEGELEDGKFINGKIYSPAGELLYEGGYQSGVPHGKGTRYVNGKVQTEGEWENGQLSGHGKSYYESGNLQYEGSFLKNRFHGPGTNYFDNADQTIRVQGEFKNGRIEGHAATFYENGFKRYEGEYVNGVPHGYGQSYYQDTGTIEYIGQYQNSNRHGEGSLFDQEGGLIYQGQFANNDIFFG